MNAGGVARGVEEAIAGGNGYTLIALLLVGGDACGRAKPWRAEPHYQLSPVVSDNRTARETSLGARGNNKE